MVIKYPRICDDCEHEYAYDSSFARHRTSGKCKRTQDGYKTIQQDALKMVHNGSGDQININLQVNNNVDNDWCSDLSKVEAALVQPILKMLKEAKIEGREKTDRYLRENVRTINDYMAVMEPTYKSEDLDEMVAKTIKQTKGLTNPKAYTEPLRLLFSQVFQSFGSNTKFTLNDMCRRPIQLHGKDDAFCSAINYKNSRDTSLGWQRAHWRNLLSDILHMLGAHINAKLCKIRQKRNEISEAEDEEKPKRDFRSWWKTVEANKELMLGDDHICKLMDHISAQILLECKNDLMKGWYRLIEYCSLLHNEDTLLAEENVHQTQSDIAIRMDAISQDYDGLTVSEYPEEARKEYLVLQKRFDATRKKEKAIDREAKREQVLKI